MNWLVVLVTCARAALYVLYGLAVVWLAYKTAGELAVTGAPTSTGRLDANHLLVPGDLSTSATAALLNRYLREPVERDKPVTPAMVSARPVLPIEPSGIEIVVNVEKSQVQARGISLGGLVQVQKDGRTLVHKGTVIALPCDETRCAVVIGLEKAPSLDPSGLVGAEVAPVVPPSGSAPGP
jgi:hypothetical protein